jgi:hypothetical protein
MHMLKQRLPFSALVVSRGNHNFSGAVNLNDENGYNILQGAGLKMG